MSDGSTKWEPRLANVSLGFIKPGDARQPVEARLEVQDDLTNKMLVSIDLTADQFARLMSSSVLTLKVHVEA